VWGEPLTSCAGADQLTSCNGQNIRYDASGNPTTYRGYTMTWQGRRLMSATNGTNTVAYAYDENGIRTQKTANETATSYRYHGSVLISQVTGNDKLLFSYDANGNITHIQQGTNHVYYQYDSLNQLTREDNSLLNQSIVYTYDNRGNLLTKQEYAYVADGGTLEEPTDTITYGYDSANQQWADQLTSYDGEDIRYDANGNPTTYRGYTMAWQGRRLTGATNGTNTISYSYDENGIRTQKAVNGTVTNYNYHGSALISQVTGNDTLLFSYDAAGNVVAVNYNGTYYYYVRNGQNNIIRLIDGDNNTVVEYAYDSWGTPLSTTGTLATTLGVQNPFRYRGYVYDAETGLYYLQTRYYDPEVSRFINADSYISTGQGILGNNMYAYCGNNPISYVDISGTNAEALGWMTGLGWIPFIDGPLPIGDLIFIGLFFVIAIVTDEGTPDLPAISLVSGESTQANGCSPDNNDDYDDYSDDNGFRNKPKKRNKGKTPGNNQSQNRQFKDATRGLDKGQKRAIHDEITGKGLGYHEIEEIAKTLFGSLLWWVRAEEE